MFKHLDPLRKWEMLKFELSNVSKEYSTERRWEEKWKKFNLKRLLSEMQEELLSDSVNVETIVDNMRVVRTELDVYESLETKRAIFRCQKKWAQCGECPSKYYFNLEKRNYVNKTMYEVRTKTGEITKDYQEILQEQVCFFRELYSSNDQIKFNLVNRSGSKLSEEMKFQLEMFVSKEELFDAMMTLKSGKICGVDGLSMEFYENFGNCW